MKQLLLVIALSLSIGCVQSQTQSNEPLLVQLSDSIAKNRYQNIHSVLIAKGKKLVYEQYFNGFKPETLHDSRSSFKSITSLLVGIAIDKGLIKNINQKMYEFFPEYPFLKTDPLKKLITIKNLLEMKAGFDCDEFNGLKDCEDAMGESKDWVKHALVLPMKDKPGEVWAYTSIDPMIISGIIRKASGLSVMDFASKYLFGPLGITSYKWTIDPSGNGMTAGSFYIRPLDMLKLGQLVKDQGVWNGKAIVSKKWIAESTQCDIPIPDFSFMQSSRSKVAEPQPAFYGYYWYKETIKTKGLQEPLIFASGNGGQYIFICENLDLTIVFTQGNYGSFKAKQAFEILAKYILPAFKPKN